MTLKQRNLAAAEAPAYTEPDAFISDVLLSAIFLDPDDADAEPDLAEADQLRRLWYAVAAPCRDYLAELGVKQTALASRFSIPLRTVQGWTLGERSCPSYVRLMIAEILGYIG